ncbi:MAG: ABC transporter permease [Candidatus Bathyarchaeia archaeon]
MNRILRDTGLIAKKELKQLSRDPLSLALTVMFPILLISIFIVISSAFRDPNVIPIVVADLDGSGESKLLIDKISLSRSVRVAELVQTEEAAMEAVQSGKVIGAIVIPEGFGNKIVNSKEAFIVVQTDNSKLTASMMIMIAATEQSQALLEDYRTERDLRLAAVEVISRPISGRPMTGDLILPGYLGLITILGAFDDAVNAITRERERGTFPRLALTPMNLLSIYGGKMVATLVTNALRTTFVLIIFIVRGLVIRGSIPLIYLTTSLMAIFTLSFGLMISTRVRSSSTLTILEIAMTFPLFQLSGAFSGPETLAPGGRTISRMLPWTWGNEALRRIIYLGLGLEGIGLDLIVLSVSTIVLLPLATYFSKRTM